MRFQPALEDHRVTSGEMRSSPGDPYGAFRVRGPRGATLFLIASNGDVPDQSGDLLEGVDDDAPLEQLTGIGAPDPPGERAVAARQEELADQ